jgi:hypothetical protein
MSGQLIRDRNDVCFVPRFPFVDGTTYDVLLDGVACITLVRPRQALISTTEVLSIHPTAAEVPRNLLRLYVYFSAPMSEGFAAECVRLEDAVGQRTLGALLVMSDELWDAHHRRLTLLLDPARIKRGLVPHQEAGYALQLDKVFCVVMDVGFHDARGAYLRREARRWYRVGADERRHVDPGNWGLTIPDAGTFESLTVNFDRPLDHGLLQRCVSVLAPGGRLVDGAIEIGPEERSWRLQPTVAWAVGRYRLVVNPILEDLAGNSLVRVFDRDLDNSDYSPNDGQPVAVEFSVGCL